MQKLGAKQVAYRGSALFNPPDIMVGETLSGHKQVKTMSQWLQK